MAGGRGDQPHVEAHGSTQACRASRGTWEGARLIGECQNVPGYAVLHRRESLVEGLHVRSARLLVRVDGGGARHAVVPRVEVDVNFALVVQPQPVLVAPESLQHGGHHQLVAVEDHEARSGSVLVRLADAHLDRLAVDAELESLAWLQQAFGRVLQLGFDEVGRGVVADQAATLGSWLHGDAAPGGLVVEWDVETLREGGDAGAATHVLQQVVAAEQQRGTRTAARTAARTSVAAERI